MRIGDSLARDSVMTQRPPPRTPVHLGPIDVLLPGGQTVVNGESLNGNGALLTARMSCAAAVCLNFLIIIEIWRSTRDLVSIPAPLDDCTALRLSPHYGFLLFH